uniref:Peptidase S1 domain-containing protein n=1 Tax=Romanomermis culicivorax TaxID=13658 RepID=A0A915HSI4_ROMCU
MLALYQKSFRSNGDSPHPNLAWSGREGVPIHTPWYKSKLLNNARATHAVPHSYPWVVSLSYEDSPYRCSGVLITNPYLENESNLILTAAHCVCKGKTNKIADDGLIVEVGKVHLNVRQISEQEVQLKTIIVHPYYDGTPWNGYDIALLFLENPVRFSRYISPIKLPQDGQKSPENKRKCLLAGWQLTRSQDSDDTRNSDIMQQIPVTILSDRQCKDHRSMFKFSPKKMRQYHFLCVTNKNGAAKASCDGDSGGPLACKEYGAYVLYGIVSYGTEDYACRRSTKPTIAMRVGDFKDWIKRETIALSSRVG